MYSFLLPSNPLNYKEPDFGYEDEFKILKENGFNVFLIDIEDIENSKIFPKYEKNDDEKIIYRGWMLNESKYSQLNSRINLVTKTKDYLKSHYMVNWYNSIKNYTFESYFTDLQHATELFKKLQWDKVFIKDFVKSIKTGKGSVVESLDDLERLKDDMLQYKGFVEGGLVFRKFEQFEQNSETRFFVINNKLYYPKSSNVTEDMIDFAYTVMSKHNSFFYSIDIVKKNNDFKVIEIGDGQVSDMVGWNINDFVKIFENLKINNKLKI
jgi:hypothetical protein